MQLLGTRPLAWAPIMLSVMRIMVGLCFLQHGMQKMVGFPPSGRPGPELFNMFWFAGAIELVCGTLLVLGLLTRPAAFLAAGEVAAAYFIGHWPRGFFPALNGGTLVVVYCFTFLYLFAAGPGPLSLDRRLFDREGEAAGRPMPAE